MEDLSNTIRIGKRETTVNLDGHNPDEVNDLRVYADNKTANPDFLDLVSDYDEWERL